MGNAADADAGHAAHAWHAAYAGHAPDGWHAGHAADAWDAADARNAADAGHAADAGCAANAGHAANARHASWNGKLQWHWPNGHTIRCCCVRTAWLWECRLCSRGHWLRRLVKLSGSVRLGAHAAEISMTTGWTAALAPSRFWQKK